MQRILDYRNAQAALRLFNGRTEDREQLAQQPALMNILLELNRAQTPGLTMQDVQRDIQRKQAAMGDFEEEDSFG